jgi:hypothetical protein
MEKEQDTLKHLFQQEFSKMVAVISKLYGLQHIEIAEDIVSETFLLAAETWGESKASRETRLAGSIPLQNKKLYIISDEIKSLRRKLSLN